MIQDLLKVAGVHPRYVVEYTFATPWGPAAGQHLAVHAANPDTAIRVFRYLWLGTATAAGMPDPEASFAANVAVTKVTQEGRS